MKTKTPRKKVTTSRHLMVPDTVLSTAQPGSVTTVVHGGRGVFIEDQPLLSLYEKALVLRLSEVDVTAWEMLHRPHLLQRPGQTFHRAVYMDGPRKWIWRACACGSHHLVIEEVGRLPSLSVAMGGAQQ